MSLWLSFRTGCSTSVDTSLTSDGSIPCTGNCMKTWFKRMPHPCRFQWKLLLQLCKGEKAVDFRGSHKHATLHTGVFYIQAEPAPVTFCIISPSRRHDPLGIWAHLDPVRKMIQEEHPNVTCLHFLSDGPASQYKQKANFIFCPLYLSRKGFPQPPGTSLKPVMARGHKMGSAEHLKELQTI